MAVAFVTRDGRRLRITGRSPDISPKLIDLEELPNCVEKVVLLEWEQAICVDACA